MNEGIGIVLAVIVGFILGMIIAISPDSVVIISGEKGGIMTVEYLDNVYYLDKAGLMKR